MAELHYFPLLAGDWLSGEATTLMTPEQEGGFIRLLCHAWLTKHQTPCSLPDDDKALAQLSRLGGRWKRAGALIKAQFKPVDGAPGRLRNRKQWAVYQVSLDKHERRVMAGREGAKARAEAKARSDKAASIDKQSSSNATSNARNNATSNAPSNSGAGLKQSESESESESESYSETTTTLPLVDATFLSQLLRHVPDRQAWQAEIDAMLSGMPGHFKATADQLETAARDMLGNGKLKHPNLRQFRRYVDGAKADQSDNRAPPKQQGDKASRSHAALTTWLAKRETTDAEVIVDGE